MQEDMKIQELFSKDIKRNINGVIKVDQAKEEEVYQELDEFVITHELRKHFVDFYNSYNKSLESNTDQIGVWISGFFGSGKSHFLKMISYLLENREVKGKKAVDFFTDKVEDKYVFSEIERASKYSTDAILFNIDSKSASDSKTRKTAIVEVFMKVFNEKLGYCAEIPWLAQIERTLDEEGNYDRFKQEYKNITGEEWIEKRDLTYFVKDYFVEAIVKTTGMSEDSASQMFENSENSYSLSTEGFAKLVKKYLDKKGKNQRIVFLVDEVGQYVGQNTDLMLNLQTVTENLGTICQGKAWVIVTSQEAIDSLTKERFKDQDFSKIQGRFTTRLNLSSSNTDEVIKRRLLAKEDFAKKTLGEIYREQDAILKNLITFSKAVGMKSYASNDDFVATYPFVPYQFDLLQSVFECIRKFSHAGKHLSEGERSMLNAFHTAAMDYADKNLNELVPFNAFYRTVETFLDSSITRIFAKARQLSELEEFDIEVLKILFMIKYIKVFSSDIENIATLMISNIHENKIELRNKINASLSRLKQVVLIQQNGLEYDFLTDEEQDVNRGIKNQSIDYREIVKFVYTTLFEEIYADRAYKYGKFNLYNFTKKVDEYFVGKQGEDIEIRFLTPDSNEFNLDENVHKSHTNVGGLLLIKLPSDRSYLEEVEQIIKTDKYIKQNSDIAKSESVRNIINAKENERSQRKKRVQESLSAAILNSEMFASGEKLSVEESVDAVKRINKALEILVKNTFYKLPLIKANVQSEREIHGILTSPQLRTDGGNKAAEEDVLGIVKQYSDFARTVTLQELKDKYSKKPYGWAQYDIAAVIAALFAKNEIKLTYNAEDLTPEDSKVVGYLTKYKEYDKLIIKLKPRIDTALIDTAKKIGREIFDKHDLPEDGEDLARIIREDLIRTEIQELTKYLYSYQNNPYPGKDVLELGQKILKELEYKKDAFSFLEELSKNADALANWKEEYKRVESFFNSQKAIFDTGIKTLKTYQKNSHYLHQADIKENIEKLKQILNNPKPYSDVKELPFICKTFDEQYSQLLQNTKANVQEEINAEWEFVKSEVENNTLDSEQFKHPFTSLKSELEKATDFNDVIALNERVQSVSQRSIALIEQKLEEMKLIAQTESSTTDPVGEQVQVMPEPPKVETKELVFVDPAKVVKTKQILETEDDVDTYLKEVETYLKEQIRSNKRIRLS